jgi:AcrR family transcriptional regulator
MPKVDDAHFDTRRKEILEAAKRVCKATPAYRITMREIVVESGMSQGGVYKYFPNIDSVFVAILNETTLGWQNRDEVNRIVAMDALAVRKLQALFDYLCSYLEATVRESGSFWLELIELYAQEPERFSAIRDQLTEVSVLEYVQEQFRAILVEVATSSTFRLVVPVDDVFNFIQASIHGIAHTLLRQRQSIGPTVPTRVADPQIQFGVLSQAVAMLLGMTYERRMAKRSLRGTAAK